MSAHGGPTGAHKGRRQSSGRETWAKFKSHQIRFNGTIPSPPNQFFILFFVYIPPNPPIQLQLDLSVYKYIREYIVHAPGHVAPLYRQPYFQFPPLERSMNISSLVDQKKEPAAWRHLNTLDPNRCCPVPPEGQVPDDFLGLRCSPSV